MSIVQNKEEIFQQLVKHSGEIRSFGVKSLGLFGSFLIADKIHPQSDIDFLVEFHAEKKTYNNFFDLSIYLEGLLNRKVELVTKESLSKYIGPHILKQVANVAI